ncbi:MAG: hypothetical protein LQ350_000446 [Teloschistes chrysophthalmus]|nr:MAG: hypothetical protein LQ350_000446 [Niorma chrysophthalma]
MAMLNQLLDAARSNVTFFAWSPLVRLSRAAVLNLLSRVEIGYLLISDTDGSETVCGERWPKEEGPATELKVLKETFWVRLLLFADMGFAESFMLGEVACSDLVSFFKIFILNREHLSNGTTLTSSLASTLTNLARTTNTLANSRLNVSAHYDISNDMFAAFLSQDMTYSCAIWLPTSDPKSLFQSLEDAQDLKLQYFINAAKIKPSDHVLEIGTGWGSFALAAVRTTDCQVTSLTLSREQKELAEERIAAAGLQSHIEVLLCDYRALPTPAQGLYDKIVSIEMLEAVGREYLDTYFECVHKLLKPDGGIAVFQCITMPESRYEAYAKSEDFIRKYIFPGGHLPTVSQLVGGINRGSKGTLVVDAILNIGGHYAKTLRLWRENFEKNFNEEIRPALLREHKDMAERDVDLFRRKWQYYFTYCEAGFSTKTLGDVILTVGREGATEMIEDIPL